MLKSLDPKVVQEWAFFFTGVDTPRSQVNIEIGGRGGIEINDGIFTMFMRWALFSRTPESLFLFNNSARASGAHAVPTSGTRDAPMSLRPPLADGASHTQSPVAVGGRGGDQVGLEDLG